MFCVSLIAPTSLRLRLVVPLRQLPISVMLYYIPPTGTFQSPCAGKNRRSHHAEADVIVVGRAG